MDMDMPNYNLFVKFNITDNIFFPCPFRNHYFLPSVICLILFASFQCCNNITVTLYLILVNTKNEYVHILHKDEQNVT